MPMELTSKNYHSNKANLEYMSNSQYKEFIACESMAMAKLTGVWKEPENDSLLIGSYVHAAIEGTLEEFRADNPSVFSKKGELYSKYEHANLMIRALQNDEFIMFVLQGQKEVIVTAEFAGAWWKVKLDAYNPGAGRFADLKTVKSIHEKQWDKRYGYVSFVEAFGYLRQLALYAEIERIASGRESWLEPLIVAVSKEDPPDKEIIGVDPERIQMELDEVKQNIERVIQVKHGDTEPSRCERCRYCRETKQTKHIVHYGALLA